MTLALAFAAGLISCLSPCVLPVLPTFVGFLGGTGATVGDSSSGRRHRAAGFLLGFAGFFVILWVSLGLMGFAAFELVPEIRPFAGVAIIILGAFTALGWQLNVAAGHWRPAQSFGGGLLMGAGIGVGWTPCIGPTLGAIVTLAAASATVWTGAALLVAYALGMAVPFVVVAFGLSRLRPLLGFLSAHRVAVRASSGLLVMGVGYLVATDAFARLAGLIPWVY
ncbi:MAG TPA: cytochrome c biogenesis CcdA family protein [Candidatus Saccharimonadales bacterium]|nr:cytochrome c biogenesis CcdA family protein [Candidatus Saccharimonadales bacterium]